MAQQQFGSKYRNNITHTRVMSLWGRNEEGTVASFNMYITGNVLHVSVYTGLNEDKQKQNKQIKFNFKDQQIPSVLGFLDSIKALVNTPDDGEKKTIQASIWGYIKTKTMDKAERRELGRLVGGRDSKGIYYISGVNNTHGKVKFNFEFDRDIVLYDINSSEPLSAAEASERQMVAFIDNAKAIIANVLTQEYVDKEDEKDNKSNNSNSNNYSQKQQASNQSAPKDNVSDDFDDFLP